MQLLNLRNRASGIILFGVCLLTGLAGNDRTARAAGGRGEWPEPQGRLDAPYIPIPRLARFYGFQQVDQEEQAVLMRNAYTRVRLRQDSRIAEVNGIHVWLHHPVIRHRRHLMLSEIDLRLVLDPLLRPNRSLRSAGHRIIVLDAGHGGSDPGGRSPSGLQEKDLVLQITLETARLLRAAGLQVMLTRSDDRALTLAERAEFAHRVKADLLVSIHLNTAGNPNAHGIESFILTAGAQPSTSDQGPGPFAPAVDANVFDGANQVLGYLLQRNLITVTAAHDRGVRRARFSVLRNAPCPAVLVEGGFLTHAHEEALLRDGTYVHLLASALAQGIQEYAGLVIRSNLFEDEESTTPLTR